MSVGGGSGGSSGGIGGSGGSGGSGGGGADKWLEQMIAHASSMTHPIMYIQRHFVLFNLKLHVIFMKLNILVQNSFKLEFG